MNVTIIYGGMNNINTYYNCIQLLLDNLRPNIYLNITEYFSQSNVSYIYNKHSSNNKISNYLYDCNNIGSVTKSLHDSDLIIIACAAFTCDISDEMKCLLSNVSYYYMKHKESSLGRNKIGLIISATPGGGLFRITKLIKTTLNYWGIHTIFNFTQNIYEDNWEYISLKTKQQIAQKFLNISYKILLLYNKTQFVRTQDFTSNIEQALNPSIYNFSSYKKHRHIQ
jgi:hypothetical protein